VLGNANWFDTALEDDPPGPIAETRASYVTPSVGHVPSRALKLKRIFPSLSGAGFPRSII
jgi:hypothetical protein